MENTERMQELLEKINMPADYCKVLMAEYTGFRQITDAKNILLDEHSGISSNMRMMLLLHIALEERENGAWSPFPEEVFLNTMAAFTRFVEFYKDATGEYGYGKYNWPLLHVTAKWFRIGELEFELYEKDGKHEIGIHIPAGARLKPEIIEDTLKKEQAFMKEYFPEWVGLPHHCSSWMLAPALDEMLPEKSGIRWFRSLFDVTEYLPDEVFYLEFVFGLEYFQYCKGVDYHELKEETTLQKKMKEYLLQGGRPGSGLGYLKSLP